ncbi:ABC transporter ATP-binding protein [Lacticaseibacillus parakribbianus]|uniref:ABC transporter ATP-binding protein n=1 Tax=Lacticaseibacillus parakribbianus TaxID=2970927 RepID=UPI0021CB1A40|nr:ATP-binding cassette domain-containing protein [Lacticaseibacillus parakribbianus]
MSTVLTVDHLDKSFGSKQVLHGVDFFVEEGHVAGLVGPNGAGKSTIMKAILGLIPVNGGGVEITGQPVSITSHQALRKVGALIEYPGIYPFLTGQQHLELFADKHNKAANIKEIVDALGMGTYINRKAKLYSLGMKQKLGIAQALVNQPKLVILDEPMNGLDPQAVKDLRDIIRKMAANGTSFLISSHILSELEKVADDVLILNHGHIVRETGMAELAHDGGVTYEITTGNLDQAKAALATANVAFTQNGQNLVIKDDEAVGTLNQALYALVQHGVAITAVDQKTRDLEASFLDMVQKDKKEA